MRKTVTDHPALAVLSIIYGYYSHINCHYLNKFVTVACGCSPIMLIGMLALSVCVGEGGGE